LSGTVYPGQDREDMMAGALYQGEEEEKEKVWQDSKTVKPVQDSWCRLGRIIGKGQPGANNRSKQSGQDSFNRTTGTTVSLDTSG
jgi:hypothetical protein